MKRRSRERLCRAGGDGRRTRPRRRRAGLRARSTRPSRTQDLEGRRSRLPHRQRARPPVSLGRRAAPARASSVSAHELSLLARRCAPLRSCGVDATQRASKRGRILDAVRAAARTAARRALEYLPRSPFRPRWCAPLARWTTTDCAHASNGRRAADPGLVSRCRVPLPRRRSPKRGEPLEPRCAAAAALSGPNDPCFSAQARSTAYAAEEPDDIDRVRHRRNCAL